MRADEVFGSPGEILILHHYETSDAVARDRLRYLVESGRAFDLGKGRSVLFHRAHVPNTKDHLHFLQNGNKLYAVNRDGTAHDASHGRQMHRWAMDAVRQRFPDFTIPPDGLIESMFDEAETWLVEAAVDPVLLSRELMAAAVRKTALLPEGGASPSRAERLIKRLS